MEDHVRKHEHVRHFSISAAPCKASSFQSPGSMAAEAKSSSPDGLRKHFVSTSLVVSITKLVGSSQGLCVYIRPAYLSPGPIPDRMHDEAGRHTFFATVAKVEVKCMELVASSMNRAVTAALIVLPPQKPNGVEVVGSGRIESRTLTS